MGEDSSTRPLTLLYLGLSLRRSENRSIILSFLSPVPRTNFIVYHVDIICARILLYIISERIVSRRTPTSDALDLFLVRLYVCLAFFFRPSSYPSPLHAGITRRVLPRLFPTPQSLAAMRRFSNRSAYNRPRSRSNPRVGPPHHLRISLPPSFRNATRRNARLISSLCHFFNFFLRFFKYFIIFCSQSLEWKN